MTAVDQAESSINVANVGLISLLLLIALCVVQYFLGRARNTFLGWILPILSFMVGAILSLSTQGTPLELFLAFLLFQFPTVILLLILGVARYGRKKSSAPSHPSGLGEMERMNIQDL